MKPPGSNLRVSQGAGHRRIPAHTPVRGLLLALAFLACVTTAQPKADLNLPERIEPAEAARQGSALVADLLAQRPEASSTNTGVMTITDAADKDRLVMVRFAIVAGPTNSVSIYETTGGEGEAGPQVLTVRHFANAPNVYQLATKNGSRTLAGSETMVPFAGSDFWVADLGLEFLHWPVQRVVRKEMRRGQFCHVLESLNPVPAPGAYSRVESWIAVNRDGVVIVQAFAYDAARRLLKEFAPKGVEKVQDQWALQKMEMRNRQARTHTLIEFQLGDK